MVAIPTPKKDVIPYHLLSQYSGFNHKSYTGYIFIHRITFQYGTNLSNHRHSTCPKVLSNSDFLQEDRNSTKQHTDEIDYQKDSSAILVTQVWEPPHI